MKKYRIIYGSILVAGIAMYIGTNERQVLILLLFWLAAFVYSGICLLVGGRKIKLSYELQDACVIHHRLPLNIQVQVSNAFPVGKICIHLKYENGLFEEIRHQEIILVPGRTGLAQYELPFVSNNCGKIRITAEAMHCCDIMGLWKRKIPGTLHTEIIVYPDMQELEIQMVKLPQNKNLGEQYDAGRKGQDVTEVFDMREYQEGDSIKSIHWKLSGKLDRLIVREFGNPSNYHTLLLYDTFQEESLDAEKRCRIKNTVLALTASVSRSMVRQNHSHHVGVMTGAKLWESFVESQQTFLQMLANMMSQNAEWQGMDEIEQFLQMGYERRYSKLILVTGILRESAIQSLAEQMDVTVLYLSSVREEQVEKGKNYEIFTLPVEGLKERVRVIEI